MKSRHRHAMVAAAVASSMFFAGAAIAAQGGAAAGASAGAAPGSGAAGPSVATPATPNPSGAAPMQQTQVPSPTSPSLPAPGTSTPSPSAAAPLQSPGSTTTLQNPNLATSPVQMPSVVPSRSETATSAFDKLAQSGATFVTREQSDRIVGFDRAFTEADRDRDGRLSKEEFSTAWAIYTGRT